MDGNYCHIEDFACGVTLGTGSFGRVRFATHRKTGRCCAIKILKKIEIMRCKQVDHIISEKAVLLSLSKNPHPFIVNLLASFQDDRYIYMILDYICGGEFFTYLRDAGAFDSNTSQFYTSLVALIFEFLHSRDIIYRDLKPEVRVIRFVLHLWILFSFDFPLE
jgi:protein kinase A